MTTAVSVIAIACFLLAIVGSAALILWLRDRRWERKGLSLSKRQKHDGRLHRGVQFYSTIVHVAAAGSFLEAAFRAHNTVSFISYLAASLFFFWAALASIRPKKVRQNDSNATLSEAFKEGTRPPGAPPPIG